MKKQKGTPVTYGGFMFNFWLDNKLSQHFTINEISLKEKFNVWLPTKDIAWINYYTSDAIIRTFLTAKEGINSVFEEKEFEGIFKVLKPLIDEYEKKNPKGSPVGSSYGNHLEKIKI